MNKVLNKRGEMKSNKEKKRSVLKRRKRERERSKYKRRKREKCTGRKRKKRMHEKKVREG